MRVVIFASGKDTGGVAIAIKRAFDRNTDWCVRAVRFGNNFIDYPADILHSPETATHIADLVKQADVIHLMQKASMATGYEGFWEKGKVLHHHGTLFRDRHADLASWARSARAVQIASTIDLTTLEPNVEWLPNPIYLDPLRRLRRSRYAEGRVPHLVHAPTDRTLKGTEAYLAAVSRLGSKVTSDLVERVDWTTCLERKAQADVVFDQVTFGYGLNGIEAWGMGIPVLSGASDWRVTKRIRETVGYLPYHPATEKDLYDRLAELVENRSLRREMAERGTQYVEDHHDERRVVERLKGIYERAVAR